MGKYYNQTTILYLNYLIKKSFAEFKPFKITETMKKFLDENYLTYFQINKKNEKNPLKIDVTDDNKMLKPSINYDIKYLIHPKYDVLGNIINANVTDFTPPHHSIERKNFFEILIEVPNLKKESLKATMDKNDTSFQYLLIYGEKNNNVDMEKDISNEVLCVRGNLEWGKFNLKIPVAPYSVRLKKKRDIEYRDGVVITKIYKGEDAEHQMLTEENLIDSNFKKVDELKFSHIQLEDKINN